MTKFWKFFEYGYLVIAILSIIEVFLKWGSNRERAYLFLFFAVVSTFMYFFRKRFRKKFEARNMNQNDS